MSAGLEEFPRVLPLTNSIKIIIPTEDYELIKKKLRHLNIVTVQPNVAKLSLYVPTSAWDTPRIASCITELLYRNGVNTIDAFLGHADIIIVVNEPDGHAAYDALRRKVAQKEPGQKPSPGNPDNPTDTSTCGPMDNPAFSPSPVEKAAESFRYYAGTIYPNRSPLYESLAMRVAEDPELLALAAQAWEKNALPNLFFAAVHFLLLKDEHHQLAAFYPSLNNASRHYDYVYPYFRNFVLERKDEISEIITTHSVQTNEVGRCAILVPAFELVARQAENRPLALIEIGSSGGLTLLWDHYHYRYDKNLQCGPPNSPVQIECLLQGEKRPPVPKRFPEIASRIGVDLNPLDLNDPENVQWLRALVWPEQQKRANQLGLAIQVARRDPPQIIRGDALELLPSLIDRVRREFQLCIFHSFTLSLASGKPREKLDSLLAKVSEKRNLFQISLEWAKSSETPLLNLAAFNNGAKNEKILAKSHAHGEWLEWLVDSR